MKKNIIYTLLLFGVVCLCAEASDKVYVEALNGFSSENPAISIDVKVLEDSAIGDYTLKTDDVMHCKITKITNPKRGKISATFYVTPISYTSATDGQKFFNEEYTGKYSKTVISKKEIKKNVKPGKIVKKAAVTVGGFFVKGLSPAVSMAEGMIKNEDGNRFKSGVHEVYENSPVAYVEKGAEVDIKAGDKFYFTFKTSQDDVSEDDE